MFVNINNKFNKKNKIDNIIIKNIVRKIGNSNINLQLIGEVHLNDFISYKQIFIIIVSCINNNYIFLNF